MKISTREKRLKKAIEQALHLLGEHADVVVILASYTEKKKTHYVSDYHGNQFAAEKMAETFCAEADSEDEDDDDGDIDTNPPDLTDSPTCRTITK